MRTSHDRAAASYAVVFREAGGSLAAGDLQLGDEGIVLTGGAGENLRELKVAFADVVEIRIGRQRADRLNGYPTLVLERDRLPIVHVAPIGIGLLHEVANLMQALASDRRSRGDRLTVVVPLKPGCLDRARSLLELGPPVDPAALGLTRHDVYLHDDEAIFVFAGPDVDRRVRRAMRSPALWRAAIDWQTCIAGKPQLLSTPLVLPDQKRPAYSWTAPGA